MGKFGSYTTITGAGLATGDILILDDISAVQTKTITIAELTNYFNPLSQTLTNKTIDGWKVYGIERSH